MPLPALACSVALCAMLPPRCALRCLHEARRPRLPGQGRSSRGGRVRVTSEALGQGRPSIGGAESEPPGPACDSCARACPVCGRRWLCVGAVPVWWVCPPQWAWGVGLAPVLAAGGVAVCRHHCGTLLCFVLLYGVLRAFVCWQISLCVSACSSVLRCLVRYAASMRCGGRGYPGRATLPVGAEPR